MFFYGWLMVIAGFLVLMISWGCQFTFSIFLIPLTEHFGWTRANTAGVFSLNMLLFGVGSIFSGKLTERFGPRAVVGVGGALMGAGLILSAAIQNLWQLYFVYGVIIGLGASTTWGPLAATVSRWFIARRGLAMGIMSLGISLGIMVIPPLSRFLITRLGWRMSFILLGLLTGLLVIGTSLLLKKEPKEKGLNPYLENPRRSMEENIPISSLAAGQNWSLSEALVTRTFWMVFVANLFWLIGFYMVSVHLAAYGTDLGLSAMAAALAISLIGGGSIFGKLFMGFLSDRIGPQKVLMINMFIQGLSIFGMVASGSATRIYLLAALFGFAYGGIAPQLPVLTAHFFGLSSLGSILGALIFSGAVGGAIGPLLGGKIFDLSQSYFWSFSIAGVVVLVSFGLIFLLRPPTAGGIGDSSQ
jgi:OFA family oxalate/formate antiporter-like MFS transporter